MCRVFEEALRSLSNGILLLDDSLQVVFVNNWFCEHMGRSSEEFTGLDISTVIPVFEKTLYREYLLQTLTSAQPLYLSGALHGVLLKRNQGVALHNLEVLQVDSPDNPYILLQITDITKQEERIKHLNSEIARRRVAEAKVKRYAEEQRVGKETVERLLYHSSLLLRSSLEELDYQQLTNEMCSLSGAYCVICRLVLESGGTLQTKAISTNVLEVDFFKKIAECDLLQKDQSLSLQGFSLSSQVRIRHYPNVTEAFGLLLKEPLELGEVYVMEISTENRIVGHFIFIQPVHVPIRSLRSIQTLSNLVGIATDRSEVEKSLRASEKRYRHLVRNIPGAVFRCQYDENRTMLYLDEAITQITGYPYADFLHNSLRTYRSIMHPEDVARVMKLLEAHQKSKQPFSTTYRIVGADEAIRWVRETCQGIYFEDQILFIDGVLTDITEGKTASLQLEYHNQLQRLITEISNSFLKAPTVEYERVVNESLAALGSFLHASRTVLILYTRSAKGELSKNYWPPLTSEDYLITKRYPFLDEKMRNQEMVFLEDASSLDPRAVTDRLSLVAEGVKSLLSLPLVENNRVIGFLRFDNLKLDPARVEGIIDWLFVALETIKYAKSKLESERQIKTYAKDLRVYGEELEVLYGQLNMELDKAKDVHKIVHQRAIPKLEQVSIATLCKPALSLGGDFFQVIKKEDQLILYLSDVTGHGLDSAMLSVFVKNTISSYIDLVDAERITPSRICAHVVRRMREDDYPLEYGVALMVLVIDVNTHVMRYSGAGMQTPILYWDSLHKDLKKLWIYGLPISNSIPEELMVFAENELALGERDRLFLATDGLYEEEQEGEIYGGRLEDIFLRCQFLPCHIFMDYMELDFLQFLGKKSQEDDISAIALDLGFHETKHYSFPSTWQSLDVFRDILTREVKPNAYKEEFLFCVHELVANAIEHGNGLDPKKKIHIVLAQRENAVSVAIEDEGSGFNWQERMRRPLDLEGDSERGRGIALTALSPAQLLYNTKGNRVSLILSPSEQSSPFRERLLTF